jgi:hypothetical protein
VSAPGSPGALKLDPVRDEIARLGDLDLDPLRLRWRKLFRASALSHLTRSLLLRIIAYRIQANAYGDLDRATLRFLDKIARASEVRRASSDKRRGIMCNCGMLARELGCRPRRSRRPRREQHRPTGGEQAVLRGASRENTKRAGDQNAAAKVLLFEYEGKPANTKKGALDEFARGFQLISSRSIKKSLGWLRDAP